MILHTVLCALRADYDAGELASIMAGLEALDIAGFDRFSHGPNIDLEGKSPLYPFGFQCQFTDRAALEAYGANPDHHALGARLVALCANGADGIFVSDLEVSA
ncbi:Dabb family protein [Celeribacter arenosi]|uniref:Stress-response A/B barrel domain-containing protein n=1 Tax=Celeribacter arenosi TaxID=792649 RepID=A0ABP7K016_9RHOB